MPVYKLKLTEFYFCASFNLAQLLKQPLSPLSHFPNIWPNLIFNMQTDETDECSLLSLTAQHLIEKPSLECMLSNSQTQTSKLKCVTVVRGEDSMSCQQFFTLPDRVVGPLVE